MTNNFSTIKNKVRSEKIILVRMNPARQVIDDLTLSAGTTYTMTFDFPVSGIKADGESYTRNDLTALSTKQFSHNEDTGLLTIRLSADISTFVAIVVYYYLFYTNSINRQATQDPEDSSTTLRNWEGRISGFPEFETTQENIIDSVLTIGNTSLNIINDDADFQKYLTDNDSFSKKEIKIWQCLNKVENIQKFFFGFATSLTIGNTVNISVDNIFSPLTKNYHSNGTHLKSIFNTTDYPSIHPDSQEKPIHKILSLCSRTKIITNSFIFANAASLQLFYQLQEAYSLTNISYNQFVSAANNNIWAACVASDASSDLTESAANVSQIVLNVVYKTDVADSNYYRVGDNLVINGSSGFSVVAIPNSTSIIIFGGLVSNGQSMIRPAISMVQINIDDTNALVLEYDEDYTYTTDANGVYNVVFKSGIAAKYSVFGIEPNAKILYRVYNHDDLSHGTIVQKIIEDSGLTVDTSSITAVNVTDITTNFSIPYLGETSFKTYAEILEDLLASTFGHLFLSNDFKIGYSLIEAISTTSEINEYDVLQGSISQTIKYSDIVTTLTFQNIHGEYIEYYTAAFPLNTLAILKTTLSSLIKNEESTYLHEIDKSKEINFIVQNMTNSKNRILAVISNRKLTVALSTKGINFSSIVGDEFNVISSKIVGILGTKPIKILSINKSADKTNIRGLDLLGL